MEVAAKFRIGKLPDAALLAQDFESTVSAQSFIELPITVRHARIAGEMAIPHQDPFDRLLIAQAQAEGMVLVSNEALFGGFAVQRLWKRCPITVIQTLPLHLRACAGIGAGSERKQ